MKNLKLAEIKYVLSWSTKITITKQVKVETQTN